MKNLSIITINYNNCKGLENTIKSVIDQTYNDYEFIVIDGGSTDGSDELINVYKENIAYGISEKDTGIYHAMNKGIAKASGNYCLFLNSGDVLFRNTTLTQVFEQKHNEDILYGNLIFDFINGKTKRGKMPSRLSFKHMIRDTLWHPVSFIKRSLFQDVGLFKEQFRIAADYDFFLNSIIVKKVPCYHLNETIVVYKFDGISSLPSSQQQLRKERKEIQLQYFTEKEIDKALKKSQFEKIYGFLKSRFVK